MKAILLIAALGLVGCGTPVEEPTMPPAEAVRPATPKPPVWKVGGYSRVLKSCDHGRAVYVFNGYRAGGIAVVENAPECRK